MTEIRPPLMLIGAGFSADFGVPTMRPFYEQFVEIVGRTYPNLVETFNAHKSKLAPDCDIEALLASLNAAASISVPETLMTPEIRRWVDASIVLRSHLMSFIVEKCEQFNRNSVAETLVPFVRRVEQCLPSGLLLFSTNYDRVIEYAFDIGGVGLADGYERAAGQLVSPWQGKFDSRFALAKLHGSVTWYQDNKNAESKFLRLDRGYPLPGPEFRLSMAGSELQPLMVLPTLEKDTLTPPYTHLSQFMADALRNSRLVVTIGSSLRDHHLLGALKYNRDRLCVLIVDRYPQAAVNRLDGVRCAALQGSTAAFIKISGVDFVEFLKEVAGMTVVSDVFDKTRQFVDVQSTKLREWTELTDDQREGLVILKESSDSKKLKALAELKGVDHPAIMAAVIELLRSPAQYVRSAAAGWLGLAKASPAIQELQRLVCNDGASVVRIEAALALRAIGNPEAIKALSQCKEQRPEAAFLWSAVEVSSAGGHS